jgi:hypothetical protein
VAGLTIDCLNAIRKDKIMLGFLGRYLTTAVVGTMVLELVLPRLRPLLVAPAPEPTAVRRAASEVRAVPPVRHRPRSSTASGGAIAPPGTPAAWSAASGTVTPEGTIAEETSVTDDTVQAAAAVQVVTTIDYTPATQLVPTSGGDVTHWGVTVKNAPFFERDGRRRPEEIDGGTLVEQIGSTTSSKGEMALCRIARGRSWAGPYLIATADLLRYEGTREQVDAAKMQELRQYFALNARLEARKLALLKAAVDANPHGPDLRRAQKAYKEAEKRAQELTSFRDRAIGAERARLADELRRMQVEVASMRERVETLNRRYKEWKSTHGVPAAVDPARDAVIRGLESEMAALRPGLADMGI